MKLYSFFRSGSSHRLRIALRLKGLDVDYLPVDLRTEQHLEPQFKALNPQGLVPALEHEYLRKQLGCDEAAVNAWCATWISAGFDALEALLAADLNPTLRHASI